MALAVSYNYMIIEGHDEATSHFMVGDDEGGQGQFQILTEAFGAAFTYVVAYAEFCHVSA